MNRRRDGDSFRNDSNRKRDGDFLRIESFDRSSSDRRRVVDVRRRDDDYRNEDYSTSRYDYRGRGRDESPPRQRFNTSSTDYRGRSRDVSPPRQRFNTSSSTDRHPPRRSTASERMSRRNDRFAKRSSRDDENEGKRWMDVLRKDSRQRSLWQMEKSFEEIPKRNVYHFNFLMNVYEKRGQFGKAHRVFDRMRTEGVQPSIVTYVTYSSAKHENIISLTHE